MSDEHVYTVVGSTATPAVPIDLADAGFRERSDLQEWVLAHPEILGDDVKIIGFEFDRWQDFRGHRQLNRLDVLGLDASGRLVVAELKRDRAPDNVHLQALTYAAMVSRLTEEDVVSVYRRLRERAIPGFPVEQAREELFDHAGELDPQTLSTPRVVLVAGSFTPATTSTVVWLTEQGLDISLQRVQAYRLGSGEIAVTVSQLFPVRDVAEFMVSPMREEARVAKERQRTGTERNAVERLITSEELPDGARLALSPTTELSSDNRERIAEWVAEDPARGQATWYNDPTGPIEWGADGQRYRPSSLVKLLVEQATDLRGRGFAGPRWWRSEDGRSLADIAGTGGSAGFDWTALHELLALVPAGTWTSYGDLASVIDTAPVPLGRHLANCGECVNAHRVLNASGASSSEFRWTDPDRTGTQQEALEAEGVVFTGGRADPQRRLDPTQLRNLIGVASGA